MLEQDYQDVRSWDADYFAKYVPEQQNELYGIWWNLPEQWLNLVYDN